MDDPASSEGAGLEVTLTLLTYNIDGLNPINLMYRTQKALAQIIHESPDVVQLQEVVTETASVITNVLTRNGYTGFQHEDQLSGMCHYFTRSFVKSGRFQAASIERIPYSGSASSRQGRDSLQMKLDFMGRSFLFINCHLESCGSPLKSTGSTIRQAQLTAGLATLMTHASSGPAILAGDLNLRDLEASEVLQYFPDVVDASVALERYKSHTWYMPNSLTISARYDRAYSNRACGLTPVAYKVIGRESIYYSDTVLDMGDETLPYCTASDHRGLVVKYSFNGSKPVLDDS